MNQYPCTITMDGLPLTGYISRYVGGQLGVQFYASQEPYGHPSINIPENPILPTQMWVRTYNEHAGFLERMEAAGILQHTGTRNLAGDVLCDVLILVPDVTEGNDSGLKRKDSSPDTRSEFIQWVFQGYTELMESITIHINDFREPHTDPYPNLLSVSNNRIRYWVQSRIDSLSKPTRSAALFAIRTLYIEADRRLAENGAVPDSEGWGIRRFGVVKSEGIFDQKDIGKEGKRIWMNL